MAYATSNPPTLISQRIGSGPALWAYKSADVDSAVNAAGYFTNGEDLGMLVGDFVLVYDTTTPKCSFHYVSAIDANGNATLAFGAVA